MEKDGVLEEILSGLIEITEMIGGVDPERLSIDGFFSGGRDGREQVEYGYKGKGVTNHLLVEAEGRPLVVRTTSAKGDERDRLILC